MGRPERQDEGLGLGGQEQRQNWSVKPRINRSGDETLTMEDSRRQQAGDHRGQGCHIEGYGKHGVRQ